MTDKEVITYLVQNNKDEYNLRKLLEEGIELNEVVIKLLNKKTENKPSIDKLIEEAGDLLVRLSVVIREYNIKDKVFSRSKDKLRELKEYIEKEQYKGGV